MDQSSEKTEEGEEKCIARNIKKKYPGLTREEVQQLLTEVRVENGGILVGLTKIKYLTILKTVMKKYFAEKKKNEQDSLKVERLARDQVDCTCTICFNIFANKFSCRRHMQENQRRKSFKKNNITIKRSR